MVSVASHPPAVLYCIQKTSKGTEGLPASSVTAETQVKERCKHREVLQGVCVCVCVCGGGGGCRQGPGLGPVFGGPGTHANPSCPPFRRGREGCSTQICGVRKSKHFTSCLLMDRRGGRWETSDTHIPAVQKTLLGQDLSHSRIQIQTIAFQ